jgi:hypothetical protein
MNAIEIDNLIEKSGKAGSIERLKTIAELNLGQRSISAKRCVEKRLRRMELMQMGFPKSTVIVIVNQEFNLN